MAHITCSLFSNSLRRQVSFDIDIPNDMRNDKAPVDYARVQKPTKLLLLLHGYTGCPLNWVPDELMRKYGFAVVCPNGENSFWLDGPASNQKFCTFIGEELIGYIRMTFGLGLRREDTCVMGLSMGGFGALHTGLAFPETFCKIGAMSSALIVHEISQLKPGEDNGVANYDYYRQCFGPLETVESSDSNPETLVKRILESNVKMPDIYMACGTEDFLIENNREMHRFLETNYVPHIYLESPGVHNMEFWSEYTAKIIPWMFADANA